MFDETSASLGQPRKDESHSYFSFFFLLSFGLSKYFFLALIRFFGHVCLLASNCRRIRSFDILHIAQFSNKERIKQRRGKNDWLTRKAHGLKKLRMNLICKKYIYIDFFRGSYNRGCSIFDIFIKILIMEARDFIS